ncbi:GTPase required for pre-60S ribosomal subunit nuclear export and maturation [Alternaria ethzedia]|uniref:GTPase required for pre-60S ribosomal subunit nuclear export and maturation n=1 Tax=Alternaria ethzedia TaxID=181014 RepID=UPI0020C382D2|nr:GTPase required for pre-60S ribosomal subunit nuclear export and maturation [Alternaria ethzedia]KAI4606577.1 GTPase required for pre-60S ribosomal subunit nuclear export and maturation [Alternaria sp. BMP 0032]KAI4612825.1 GTPase required for pre-60S ribosomal subunit nuclear export and maturation [Alternaria ethzedia]
MGVQKKEYNRKEREGKTGDGMGNVKTKGANFYRDAKKVKLLKRLTGGTAERNAKGDITKAAVYQNRAAPVARVEPNRKWFNNTRVISQDALDSFRSAVEAQSSDPTTFLMKRNKLPMSLIETPGQIPGLKQHAAKIAVGSQPFSETFGPKAQRKRPKLDFSSIEDLAGRTGSMHETYVERLENAKLLSGTSGEAEQNESFADNPNGELTSAREFIFMKGTSKRIWNELYKVIDSSDVILHVLDARDPDGTRCRSVEKYIRTEAPHKHLVFVLNKVDLVPSKVAAAWVRHLSKEFPTLAFHASINNSFGKGSLIALLRQFSSLHSDRKQVSVGMVGYPNTGKSSIINTLRKKKVCVVAPIAGETKVWQYITLMKRIYMIDCPGIVPPNQNDTDTDLLLRGSVRVENVEYPAQYIEEVLKRVQPRHLQRTYDIKDSDYKGDAVAFLENLCRKSGRLLKGGEADIDGAAKMVLNDWIRGKLPWFTPPPYKEGEESTSGPINAKREGKLGEMSKKRKRGGESEAGEKAGAKQDESDYDSDFSGFSDEDGLELDGEDDDEEEVSDDDEEGGTTLEAADVDEAADDDDKSEDDEVVEKELAAITSALSKAKKRQKTT